MTALMHRDPSIPTGKLEHLERFTPEEQQRILAALDFAAFHHRNHKRISGEPYVTHLLAVAQMLIDDFEADANTVIAGLLHDTVEDVDVTLEQVEENFGSKVRTLVDAATNVGEGDGHAKIHDWYVRTAASHKKVRRIGEEHGEVYLIKIADRIHNMRSCSAMRPFNQLRMADDVEAFSIPLCRELGLNTAEQILVDLVNEVRKRNSS
jgi:GTP diphosphokinase / guanosine-3',5'-bis(diphosphate) 3'-diphosphatase